jgi:hypothetical protein
MPGIGDERKAMSDRMHAGRVASARLGLHTSGAIPYGYMRDQSAPKKHRPLILQPLEAERVRLMFHLYLRYRSMGRVLAALDGLGVRTRRGGRFQRQHLAFMLRNQTYLGRVHFGGVNVKGHHEAIVAPIIFWKVGKLMAANRKRFKACARDALPKAPRAEGTS